MSTTGGLVRSMAVIGSSTSVGIVLGIIRVKALALLLGPGGVGVVGIFESIQHTGMQIAGLGLDQSGVRRVASSQGDLHELVRVRRTLMIANLAQGMLGMTGLWLLRDRIALWMFNQPGYGDEVGFLGIGVLLSLIAAAQMAQLQGLRRIDELAKTSIASGVLTTAMGIVAIWRLGADGLVLFVLAQPLFLVLISACYVARLPRTEVTFGLSEFWHQWRSMAGMGATFMFAGLLAVGGLLAARSLIVDSLGLDAAGYFQAAWAISIYCVGFVLASMGADYFPRLSGIIDDRMASADLVNDQAQAGFALGGPVLLAFLGLAPWIIELFYSTGFGPAVAVLQWLCIGNYLKFVSWPTGFVAIARQDKLVYAAFQVLWQAIFLGLLIALLPRLGVEAAGVSFVVAYSISAFVQSLTVRKLHGFRWQTLSLQLFVIHLGLAAALLILVRTSPLIGAAASVLAAGATGIWGLRVVAGKIGPEGRLGVFATRLFRALRWPLPEAGPAADIPRPGPGE